MRWQKKILLLFLLSCMPIIVAGSTINTTAGYVWTWKDLVEKECPQYSALIILSLIAQESGGNPKAVRLENNGRESVGLMQIHTFDWRPTKSWLLVPANNIRYGCQILDQIDADTRDKLAIYNCGEIKVERGLCGPFGGYFYADRILEHWLPQFYKLWMWKQWMNVWLTKVEY